MDTDEARAGLLRVRDVRVHHYFKVQDAILNQVNPMARSKSINFPEKWPASFWSDAVVVLRHVTNQEDLVL